MKRSQLFKDALNENNVLLLCAKLVCKISKQTPETLAIDETIESAKDLYKTLVDNGIVKVKHCKYIGCHYYHKKAIAYCCNACAYDAYDYHRLHGPKKKGK